MIEGIADGLFTGDDDFFNDWRHIYVLHKVNGTGAHLLVFAEEGNLRDVRQKSLRRCIVLKARVHIEPV